MGAQATTRRSFLSKLFAGTLLAGAGAVIASVLAYLFPREEVSSALGATRVRVGDATGLPRGRGKLTLVEDEPVWVVHGKRGFAALSAWCTHRGCIVRWEGERRLFACPCHEGLFDEQGHVISGLPLRPLKRFHVGLVENDLYVWRWEAEPGGSSASEGPADSAKRNRARNATA
jgi:Rieske Fe-S protein